ncbi:MULTISPECIES: electron transport complex subunit RsxD [Aeromonas]|uniref:electron transport complex subunit RsxD n=1 Tax=Aeromonas TaxID=642 RepID=UPI0005AB8163|nr:MULTISPECIES: electron transport complex subunit RsxD [Aeromonas]QXC33481.1 electron transport complex subunit RsxD [Aeromonas sp. FDAARGOS 1407]UBH52084.1 electron transport complex subunit RsxD [Aeromonas enteropelogenes]UCA09382.1 electron transport complex subunit RsxD [Aeromonas enteropelogenes]
MFNIATAPFAHNRKQTRTLMLLVILACVPGFLAQTWFFGWGTLIQILLALVTALGCEALVLKLRGRAIKPTLLDGSAALTAVLIGLSLPPLLPWWMLVVGTAFAVIIAKHLYGGLGQNLFNPAMVAYVLLLVSFPVQMTSWLPPESVRAYDLGLGDALSVIFTGFSLDGYSMAQLKQGVDGLTMATPLDTLKTGLTQGLTTSEILSGPLFEGWGGIGWSWVNLGYLLGGLFLLQQKVINWRITVAVLGALLVSATLGYLLSPDATGTPIFHLFSGATMLGAFFIATDPVTASTTPRGRLAYGVLIGVLVYIIRRFGGYPDAFAFAVLLANLCVPLIDSLTRPKVYGARRK